MDSYQLSLIGIRLIAIYLIAQGISAIPDVYLFLTTYVSAGDFEVFTFGSVLTAIFSPAVVGILAWLMAPKLSKFVVTGGTTTEQPKEINIPQLQIVAITLAGLYLFASSLPFVFSLHYQLYHSTIEVNGQSTLNMSLLSSAIAADLKAIFGIALILGSHQISRLISKLRGIGTN